MLRWHRLTAFWTALLLAYVILTGAGIELADMRALVTHASATDPDMLMLRQHIDGPPNYAVVSAADYTAAPLPAGFDFDTAIHRAAELGRIEAPGQPLRLVEVRTVGGAPAVHVRMGERDLIYDLASSRRLPDSDLPPAQPSRDFSAPRASFKYLHRFNYLGQAATGLNFVAGIALSLLIFTGIAHYLRLLRARARTGRPGLFWKGGNRWRQLHRWVSIVAAVFVVWLTATGLLLAADNFGAFMHGATTRRPAGPDAFAGDWSSPISSSDLSPMVAAALSAFRSAHPETGVKVLQIRYFAGYPQGVVVAADADTSQFVYDTRNGAPLTMHEPEYPDLGFPSGWEWHQRLKRMHRGDIFGMIGRWLDTLGALALVYLVVSGIVMYCQMMLARRRAGRSAVTW